MNKGVITDCVRVNYIILSSIIFGNANIKPISIKIYLLILAYLILPYIIFKVSYCLSLVGKVIMELVELHYDRLYKKYELPDKYYDKLLDNMLSMYDSKNDNEDEIVEASTEIWKEDENKIHSKIRKKLLIKFPVYLSIILEELGEWGLAVCLVAFRKRYKK